MASRRKAEKLMLEGRVRVNGEPATELGIRVRAGIDRVEVDGRPVELAAPIWLLFHKPIGVVTTRSDPEGRPTVYDRLPTEYRDLGLVYVGRLDLMTSGLLLLGNEGDVVHGLTHPSREIEREYRAGVEGVPSGGTLRRLEQGVELEDGWASARRARVSGREKGGAVVELVLTEGRNREARRLCEAVGHRVRWLERVRFGPIVLGDLKPGAVRRLAASERRALLDAVGLDPGDVT